ncbi:hypothetical protein QQZ08_005729 [Neonectria magnoliae]|uniref:Uncharacterized protein n=1 Tax=Neonectria magnoliae TaxID=2732573 RepID=A0ABR1I361_9HYPO
MGSQRSPPEKTPAQRSTDGDWISWLAESEVGGINETLDSTAHEVVLGNTVIVDAVNTQSHGNSAIDPFDHTFDSHLNSLQLPSGPWERAFQSHDPDSSILSSSSDHITTPYLPYRHDPPTNFPYTNDVGRTSQTSFSGEAGARSDS